MHSKYFLLKWAPSHNSTQENLSMNNLTVSNILSRLDPRADVPWGFMIYIVIVLSLITLFMQKENSPFLITLLLSGAIMASLIEKVQSLDRGWVISFQGFILRAVMLTFPLVVAGMTKTPKSRGFAIGAALMGGIYLFARWATNPR
jgi:hypothetical protein